MYTSLYYLLQVHHCTYPARYLLHGTRDAYWHGEVVLGNGYFDLELDVDLQPKAAMIQNVTISILCVYVRVCIYIFCISETNEEKDSLITVRPRTIAPCGVKELSVILLNSGKLGPKYTSDIRMVS